MGLQIEEGLVSQTRTHFIEILWQEFSTHSLAQYHSIRQGVEGKLSCVANSKSLKQ